MTPPRRILIVGGGTAGWMAATLLAQQWGPRGTEITLVESPEIGIIGVGEGSTPQLKAFFERVGITEAQWMPRCHATYKVGIRFEGWSARPGFDSYFHPFQAPLDDANVRAFVYHSYLRRNGVDVDAHPDRYFVATKLAAEGRGPHPAHHFPFPLQYGYHFDSQLLGQFLRDVAVTRGVRHVEAEVQDVVLLEDGSLRAVRLSGDRRLEADFFVDSTGFRGLLLQKALGVPFVAFTDNLFNESAVVLPSPDRTAPRAQTVSRALRHGWAWDIPLTHRTGNGYVYSAAHCSADEAERELRSMLDLLDAPVAARHLKMRVGRVATHWHHNCLAVGLSQGFIEPLEATALHVVHETIAGFIESMEAGDFTDRHRARFNEAINRRFEGIRSYIVCHYRASSRDDTDYWRANATNERLPESLRQLLHVWLERDDLTLEIERQQIAQYYNTVSWHCLLAGYGLFPRDGYRPPRPPQETRFRLADVDDFVARCALNYAPHATQLAALAGAAQ